MGAQSARAAQTVTHKMLNRADPDVTLRAASTRAGTLRLMYTNAVQAQASEVLHSQAKVFTLTPTGSDPALMGMSYVVSGGDVDLSSATDDALQWVLTVPYVQVIP